jgi:hexokinase
MTNFELSIQQLQEIVALYRDKIAEGLKADRQQIGCLPTYLGLPSGQQSGRALVVDTGGTNMRAALINLKPADGEILSGPVAKRVPDGRDGVPLEADQFFDAQAKLAEDLVGLEGEAPLGYCFSYPVESTPDGDAVLIRWTKGLRINNVVGHRVGHALIDSLHKQNLRITRLSVLNDTVASLLGGVHLYGAPRFGRNYIGLILGTGTNMAAVFTPDQLTKINIEAPMVVNLESGNFSPPHLTRYDDELDAESVNVGAQRFEKAVSGHYLPQIFHKLHPDIDLKGNSASLVALRDSGKGEASKTAGQLLTRSARMVAAGLAAVAGFYPEDKDTAVLGEGGLFWGDKKYAPMVRETLSKLLPGRNIELIAQRENVNLLGAACAAIGTPVKA